MTWISAKNAARFYVKIVQQCLNAQFVTKHFATTVIVPIPATKEKIVIQYYVTIVDGYVNFVLQFYAKIAPTVVESVVLLSANSTPNISLNAKPVDFLIA